MRPSLLATGLGLFLTASSAKIHPLSQPQPDQDALEVFSLLQKQAMVSIEARAASDGINRRGCSLASAVVRKDWCALCSDEKKDYIKAVQCLQRLPSKSDPAFAPGARTRYDDFVAIHINKTLEIHGTGNFLTWHRYFVWAYENALKKECNYKGAQPYWNYFAHQDDISKSPVYDGSDTSMSGDGEFFAHNGSLSGTSNILLPSGKGGGCVKSGPFKDMVVNLGPVSPGMDGLLPNPKGPMAHNPRCLRRDLNSYATKTWMTAANLLNITVGSASGTIQLFQDELQGRFSDGFLGIHAAGHYTAGGDATDLFSSPTDPSFFLHHSMIDHLYWIWQVHHLFQAFDIAGTITILNQPPSRDAVKTDPLDLGIIAPVITIGDALNTLSGSPFCYIYA
jgi:tyrosinase